MRQVNVISATIVFGLAAIIVFGILAAGSTRLVAQDTVPKDIVGSQFALPVMKDGKKNMLVRGETVKSFGAFVNLSDIQIQLYPNEKMDAIVLIFSLKASYDTTKESASSKERVNVHATHPVNGIKPGQQQYRTVINGTGFDFFNKTRTIGIRSKVVALMEPIPAKDAKAKKGEVQLGDRTNITSKRLDYQLAKKPTTITFDGAVNGTFTSTSKDIKTGKPIVDQFNLTSDKLVVLQGGEQSMDTFEATGSVTITQLTGNKLAASGKKAECAFSERTVKVGDGNKTIIVKTRIVTLTGNPVLTTPRGKLTGAEIVVIKKIGERPPEAFTLGGRPKMVILSDADRKLLPDFASPSEKKPAAGTKKGMVVPPETGPKTGL